QIKVGDSHIVFRIPGNAKPAEIEEGRARVENLRQETVSGKVHFAEAARNNSQCPCSQDGADDGQFYRKHTAQDPTTRPAFPPTAPSSPPKFSAIAPNDPLR